MKTNLIIVAVVAVLLITGGIGFFIANQYASNIEPETTPPETTPPETTPETSPPETSGAQTHNVEIDNFAFSPSSLTISVGDTVIWTNLQGVSHTVTSDSGNELDSEFLSNGETYSHTFSTAGTFNYHCSPHSSMKGTIIVS
ncbi:MAG: cupredoxin family copper-binding protein [Candidatus Pacearchaeota archaeon]|nr:cupredoxin family copper-binding protein [Candidatus Pacearchaeota archaeon]